MIPQIQFDKSTKEITEHGTIFLPVNMYHTILDADSSILMPHWHEEMEVTLIEKGPAKYRIHSKPYIVNSGDIVLVSPHALHSAIINRMDQLISDSLVFHVNYLGAQEQDLAALNYLIPLMHGQFETHPVIHPNDSGYETIKGIFVDALRIFREKPAYYEIKLKLRLLELILSLFENNYIVKTTKTKNELDFRRQILETLNYIHTHFAENLSISDLAKAAGFSESHFMFLFKEYVGTTCINYINYYRIQNAAQLLRESGKTVLEIASENGYDNISYFNRRFRAQFGMTPKEYRSNWSNQNI